MTRLEGIDRKLRRSHEHLKELKALVDGHIEAHPISLIGEPQDKSDKYFVKVSEFEPLDFIDIGVRIGEAVHLYRSILENLVWHLSIENTGQDPPPDPKSVGFPIINVKTAWEGRNGQDKIASVADEPAAIIQEAQPYRERHAPNPEPLALLASLNNIDKHRTIIPIATMPESFDQVGKIITSEKDVGVAVVRTNKPVEKNAILWIFQFTKPTYVEMEYHAVFEIVLDLGGFKNTGFHTHYPFGRVLGDIHKETNKLVTSLNPFL